MWASHLYFRTNDGSGCGNDGGVSWLPVPRRGGRVSNPPLQAGTAARQQHRLPAGGHVGPPLRLVTRASLTRTAPGRAGFKPAPTGGNGCPPATSPTGGRTRGSAPTAGHARIPLTPSLTRTAPGRAGFKPAPTGGNGCPPATSPAGGRTRGSIVPTNCHFSYGKASGGQVESCRFRPDSSRSNTIVLANGPVYACIGAFRGRPLWSNMGKSATKHPISSN